MSIGRMGVRAALAAAGVLVSVALMSASASAATSTTLCVPTGENTPVKTTLKNGTCASTKTEKYTLTEFQNKLPLSEAEVKTLQGILPCIKSVEKGIDEKPTVQFHGCNVQIVNGQGATETTNGVGNLVIGYDELRKEGVNEFAPQTGSHNLVLGIGQSFTAFGGLLAGVDNTLSARWASVSGGLGNTASAPFTSISGGINNVASGEVASVSGGSSNVASSFQASVSGGSENTAAAEYSSISGGERNLIPHSGGQVQWIGGGQENEAAGNKSAIFGGHGNIATGEFEALP
jgi:hypothetical protein